jgi:hypothetical protein
LDRAADGATLSRQCERRPEMIALLLAAAVSVQPMVPHEAAAPPDTERMPNLYSVPARCGAVIEREVRRQQVALRGRSPLLQYAVLRRLDGCPVPAPVGYHPDYVAPGAAARPEGAPAGRR